MEQMQQAAIQLESAANETITPTSTARKGRDPGAHRKTQTEYLGLPLDRNLGCGRICRTSGDGVVSDLFPAGFGRYFPAQTGQDHRSHPQQEKKITLQVLDEITAQIQRYLLVQIFTSFLVGVATWLAFLWIGLEHAAIWASFPVYSI